MKFSQVLVFILHLVSLTFAKNQPASLATPLYFEPNQGQFPSEVRFAARAADYTAWITNHQILLCDPAKPAPPLRIGFASPAPKRRAHGLDRLPGTSSYFLGSQTIRNVPSFARVRIEEIYPGIDLLIYGGSSTLEYDFIVKPGADPSRILVDFDPRLNPQAGDNGNGQNLQFAKPYASVRHRVPKVHQNGVALDFRARLSGSRLHFEIPNYDRKTELVIDPVIAYELPLVTNGITDVASIAVDAQGAAYVAGTASGDAFVTKVSANPINGSYVRIYSIYFGGSSSMELVHAIAVDASGAAYVTGQTWGSDFPLKNAFTTAFTPPYDGFVAKIGAAPGPDGYDLVYCSYLGSVAKAIAVSPDGSAHLAGATMQTSLTMVNAFQPFRRGGSDAFVMKIAAQPSGGSYPRIYTTYLGGTSDDEALGIALDASGATYVTGWSLSADFPLVKPIQAFAGFRYAVPFLTKISATPSGNGVYDLAYSTAFAGRQGSGSPDAITVDSRGAVHIVGRTDALDFPLIRSFQNQAIGLPYRTGFVARFFNRPDDNGTFHLDFTSYLGGDAILTPKSIAVDGAGGIHLGGAIVQASQRFPAVDQLYRYATGTGSFAAKISVPESGNGTLVFSSEMPGTSASVAADSAGNAFVAGNGYVMKLAPGASTNRLIVNTQPQGQVVLMRGADCNPAEYRSPVTITWKPGATCDLSVLRSINDPASNQRYEFVRWDDGFPDPMRVIVATPATVNLTAIYRAEAGVKLLVDNPARGTVSAPAGYFPAGTVVPISATPSYGYSFVRWTGNGNVARVASPNTTVTVGTEPVILTANFVFGDPGASPSQFVPVTPCRLIDTRPAAIPAQSVRNFGVAGNCGIPPEATAYSLNVTAIPRGPLGYLTVFPTGQVQPMVSTLNSLDGRIKANAAIVPAGSDGRVSVYVTDSADVVLDVNGYFIAPSTASLAYYPLPPCRILDTRSTPGATRLTALNTRTIAVRQSGCGVPASARAYALNATVIPAGTLGFLRIQPTGSPATNTSTINAPTGTVVANAAIIPAGTNGSVDVLATEDTHLLLDINGYFAPPGAPGGLNFYPLPHCRMLDSRSNGSTMLAGATATMVNVAAPAGGGCPSPRAARVLSLNATVLPQTPVFGFLTLYPADLTARPMASTLNAVDGALTSNAALIEVAIGQIAAYVSEKTHLVLDLNGYFAP
jgi:hypothetical protein